MGCFDGTGLKHDKLNLITSLVIVRSSSRLLQYIVTNNDEGMDRTHCKIIVFEVEKNDFKVQPNSWLL